VYALMPGSSPESHVMMVSVLDRERFNGDFSLDVEGVHGSGGATFTDTLGFSMFVGPTGEADLTIGGDSFVTSSAAPTGATQGVGLRYSAYGLFGTSAYVAAGLRSRAGLNPSFLVGVPLGLMQTLRGTYQKSGDSSNSTALYGADWLSDSTDDPFFPRRGYIVTVGPQWSRQHYVLDFNAGTRFHFHDDTTIRREGLAVSAEKFWPLAKHSAAWGSTALSRYNETGIDNGKDTPHVHETNIEFIVGLAHNFDAWMGDADSFHRGNVEGGVGYKTGRRDYATGFHSSDQGAVVRLGFSYRSRWGVVHFSASFIDD
jgi:hypothetical protein